MVERIEALGEQVFQAVHSRSLTEREVEMASNRRNERLRAALTEAGCSYEALARRVNDLGRAHGVELIYDKSSVSHWVGGKVPRGLVPTLIAEVLSDYLGRGVDLPDIGFAEPASRDVAASSLTFASTWNDALTIMEELGRADVNRRDFVRLLAFSAAASSTTQRDWLLHVLDLQRSTAPRVGSEHVAAVTAMEETFTRLDNQFGGGEARTALVSYLTSEAIPLLSRDGGESTKSELSAMIGQLYLTVGWMTFDIGATGLAQRYLTQGLYLAREAGPAGLTVGAQILSASSQMATVSGDPKEGLSLARGAVHTARRSSGRATLMRAQLMESRALAVLGERSGAHRAMLEAESVVEGLDSDEEAPWNRFQDATFLAYHESVAFRELDDPDRMLEAALRSLTGGRDRQSLMGRINVAHAELRRGDYGAACSVGMEAATALKTMKSVLAQEATYRFIEELRNAPRSKEFAPAIAEIVSVAGQSINAL